MFGFGKNKGKKGKGKSKQALVLEAEKNMAAARANLGQDTINKLQAKLSGQEPVNPAKQAKAIIESMDKHKLSDNLLHMMREKE